MNKTVSCHPLQQHSKHFPIPEVSKGCRTCAPCIKGIMTSKHWGKRQQAPKLNAALDSGKEGGVAAVELTSSRENTKITTNC